jgi:hypothetical protein
LELGCRDFYKYFEPIIGDNEIFIFPISVLEQFRIEYLLPALLFSFFFKKEFINKKIIFFGNCPISHAKKIIEKFSFIDAIVLN